MRGLAARFPRVEPVQGDDDATAKSGREGPEVGAIGLGCIGRSDFYGPADRAESIATINAALDSGATLIDTGDFYGTGHNEIFVIAE